MIVTVDSGQFKGIVTARDLTGYPIDTLIGTLNKDTTELTLQPYYGTTYENPWKVSSDSITGGIQSPPSMVRSYEFAKQ